MPPILARLLPLPALLLVLLIGGWTPAEEAKFPRGHDAIKKDFKTYFALSASTLRQMDQWTEGKVNNGAESRWVSATGKVMDELLAAEYVAEAAHQQAGGGDALPDAVLDWIESERRTWENIREIGPQLIVLHDQIVDLTGAIETQYTNELESMRETADALATTLEKTLLLLADATGVPTVTMPDGAPDEIMEQYDKELSVTAMALQRVLLRARQDVEGLAATIKRDGYSARLKTLENKDIDPDQQGVFVKHEQTWERNLRAALQTFERAHAAYLKAAKPLYEGTALDRYSFARAGVDGLVRHVQEVVSDTRQDYERALERLGPPMAGIDRVTVRDFREVGARQNVRVLVKNMGKVALQAGTWTLKCTVEEHPKHHRLDARDFACDEALDKDLAPGRTHTFALPFTAPEAAGEWTVRWELWHEGELIDNETETTFMVLGEVHAEIDRIRMDGKTSRPKLEAGRPIKIEVTVENTGTEPLFRNRCELVVSVEEAPRGYKAQRKDFAVTIPLRKDVLPGTTHTFTERITVPEGVGAWEVKFDFKANRKTIDTAVVDVLVETD